VFYAVAGMMVVGSAVHALWVPRGLAIKYADTVGAFAPELIAALRRYWEIAYDLAAVPAYFGAILLAILVVPARASIRVGRCWQTSVFYRYWHRWQSGLQPPLVQSWSAVLRIFLSQFFFLCRSFPPGTSGRPNRAMKRLPGAYLHFQMS